jgi:hypothetical protein
VGTSYSFLREEFIRILIVWGWEMKKASSYTLLVLAIVISLPVWVIASIGAVPIILNTLFVSPQEQFGAFAFLQVFDYTINVVTVLATIVVPVIGIPTSIYFLVASLRKKDLRLLTLGHHAMWLKSAVAVLGLLVISLITGQDAVPSIFGNPLSLAFWVLAPILSLVGLLFIPRTRNESKSP